MDSARHLAYVACLRFFAELRALGVSEVVVSPGSRSTALAISAATSGMNIVIHHDERVAAFHALGAAKATRRPVVLVCTSGTAGANYHSAVIEAHHAGVPLIVCTADRPPELRSWGAGQTIDQVRLFGDAVRWFHEPPLAHDIDEPHARSLALRAFEQATRDPGPVHLNWGFREPLEPEGPLTTPTPSLTERPPPRSLPSERLRELATAHERGLIVVGPDDLDAPTAGEIMTFSLAAGWPVIADPASGLRCGPWHEAPTLITTAELVLGAGAFTSDLPTPEVVVRVGLSPTSKAYRLWLEGSRPDHLVLVGGGPEWSDPTGSVTEVISGPVAGLFAQDAGKVRDSAWMRTWHRAEQAVRDAATAHLAADEGELGVTRGLLEQMIASGVELNMVVSNSMPVRDLDFVLRATDAPIRIMANRGASGIDGVIATGLGVASSSPHHTYVFIGDVATVHDLGGLAAVTRLGVTNMTVVVIDNDGGGIFSILPVGKTIDASMFDQLFTTPHGTDIAAVASALGYAVTVVGTDGEVRQAEDDDGRPRLVLVKADIAAMTDGVAALRRAVGDALG